MEVTNDFVELLRLKADSSLTSIMNTVKNSPLNVALLSVLNHCEFVVTNPIVDEITGELHANARKMANHIGPVHMANLFQSGYAYFNSGRRIKLKQRFSAKIVKKEQNDDNEEDEEVEKDEEPVVEELKDDLQKVIKSMLSNNELPSVEDLTAFIKKAFSSLLQKDFIFFQSILPDFWVFQQWNRPWDYKEEICILRILAENTITPKPTVDLTGSVSDEDDLGLAKMVFGKIAQSKQPVGNGPKKTSTSSKSKGNAQSSVSTTPSGNKVKTPDSGKTYASSASKQRKKGDAKKGNNTDGIRVYFMPCTYIHKKDALHAKNMKKKKHNHIK